MSPPRTHTRQPRRSLAARLRNQRHVACSGQATVEYLVVGVALIVIIMALGALSGRVQEGLFVQHAADSASHAFTTNTAGSVGDVLLY
ncbi:MAG: hypothetical protein LBL23_07425 [Coriobacteriales bacterium]|nr:hypothetical protein [Coriobacteriales bacterium]